MQISFQKSVCQAMTKIPRGKVTTYGNLAKFLKTKAVRAVGTAVGKNPDAPQVLLPEHSCTMLYLF
jgi:O-6-methylguanine DNA methyltransferase